MTVRRLPNVFQFRKMEDLITPIYPFDRFGIEYHEGLLDCAASLIAIRARPTPFENHSKPLLNWQLVLIDTTERQSIVCEVSPFWTCLGFQSKVYLTSMSLEELVQSDVADTFWWRQNMALLRKDPPRFQEIIDHLDTQEAEEMIVDAYTQENTYWWIVRLLEKLAKPNTRRTTGLSTSPPILPPRSVHDFTAAAERWFQTRRNKYYKNRGNEDEADLLLETVM